MVKQVKNVLLLIENKRVSALTAKLLEVHGFACTQAHTFTQALTHVGSGAVRVALVDFGLEPDDGCRFAAEAKKLAEGLPVVVCDPEPAVARAQRVRKSEAFDYLTCPFVVADLVGCLRRATALLASARRPFEALDAYLAANGATPEIAAEIPAAAESEAAVPASAASVVAASEDLLARERALLAALRTNGVLNADLETRAAERLQREAAAANGTMSALASLELVNEEAWERAAEWVADARKAPPVDFGAFPPDESLVRAADAAVLRRHLAVPFAKLEAVTLVAMPNPDADACAAVEKAVGGECRFFTCSGLAAKSALERALAPKEDATA